MDKGHDLEFKKGYAIAINDFDNNIYYYFDYDTRLSTHHMRFPHIHTSFYEILISLDSDISYIFNGVSFPLKKYDLALVAPGVPHQSVYPQTQPPRKRLIINFMYPEALLDFRRGYRELLKVFQTVPPVLRLNRSMQSTCFSLLNSIYSLSHCQDTMPKSIYEMLLQARFEEFLAVLYQAGSQNEYIYTSESSSISQKISEICSYIHTNYMEALSLESLAGTFYISPYYLSRQFKKITGFGLNEYIQNTRIINAQYLLSTTEQTISEIAASCGFSSFSQFNRLFHQKHDCSPSQYRKTRRYSISV